MPMRQLPCDDPKLAARRAKAREIYARVIAPRKRAAMPEEPPRQVGRYVFEPVTCPRCGDVFRGSRPLHSYACHRNAGHCPWSSEEERAAHAAHVYAVSKKIAVEHQWVNRHSRPPKPIGRPRTAEPKVRVEHVAIPPLHTGHELFERARAARRCWPQAPADGQTAHPIWEDLLSEGVLALLEGRDPAEAMRRFYANEGPPMLSIYAPLPGMGDKTLLDVLAA